MIRIAKPLAAFGLAGALALAVATPSEARSGRNAAAIGAGVAGFAIGAAAGAAAANNRYYGPAYGYYGEPAYVDSYAYAPAPTYYYGGDPSGYYAPTYVAPRYRYWRGSTREDHLTGSGAGFIH